MSDTMTRGELANRAGVNAETIRYYEQRGVLPEASRTASGYRIYCEEDVARLQFVQRSQDLGFTLSEIAELLDLRDDGEAPAEDVRTRAHEKLAEVNGKIRDLERIRDILSDLVSECREAPAGEVCPILRALDTSDGEARLSAPGETR